jgi:hypothetical protein
MRLVACCKRHKAGKGEIFDRLVWGKLGSTKLKTWCFGRVKKVTHKSSPYSSKY